MHSITLSQIIIYPVKSLKGINITTSWPVTETGLKHDRKWMLIDDNGQFLSQRTLPAMALISTAIKDNTLILSASGFEDLTLPLTPVAGEIVSAKVWQDHCQALRISKLADQWLSDCLQQTCHLIYQPDDSIRAVDPDYANATDRVSFADAFPFLLIAESSLEALNQEIQLNLPMTRFRPNLVVSGCASYSEDSWREISIGAIDFRLPKPCSRCSIPTIDPETAETGKEPLTTLNRLRKWRNKVYFGQNVIHNQCGLLSVGDIVIVKRTGENQPPL